MTDIDRGYQGNGGTMAKPPTMLIRGGRILSMDPQIGDLDPGDLVIRNGIIEAVDVDIEISEPCEIVEAAGKIVMPGLVDTHTHVWNGVWRTYAGTAGPETAYGELGVRMGPLFTPEESYLAVLAGALEMATCGVTTVHNWAHNIVSPEHADAEVQALVDAGVRSRFSYGYCWTLPQDRPMNLADVQRVRDQWSSDRVEVGLALRNDTTPDPDPPFFPTLSVPPSVLKEEMRFARDHGIPLTMHIRNRGSASYYIENEYIAPDNLIVHGYYWEREDWKRVGDTGAPFSISPYSALLGLKRCVPLGEMLDAGVTVGLSCDHMNRSGNADLFRLMQILVINEALRTGTGFPWRRSIELATLEGARSLGMEKLIGSLTPGKKGDVILVDGETLTLTPVCDLGLAIANAAGPNVVDTVIVDGQVLKRDGQLTGWNPRTVARSVETMFDSLRERVGTVGVIESC